MVGNMTRFVSGSQLVRVLGSVRQSAEDRIPSRLHLNKELGNTLRQSLSKWRSLAKTNPVTFLVLQFALLVVGGIFCWLLGWTALAGYSFGLMVMGAVVILAGIASSYRKMGFPTISEIRNGALENDTLGTMSVKEEMAMRFAGFKHMLFFCTIGIVSFGAGVVLQSLFF